jgi:hypothetical protein
MGVARRMGAIPLGGSVWLARISAALVLIAFGKEVQAHDEELARPSDSTDESDAANHASTPRTWELGAHLGIFGVGTDRDSRDETSVFAGGRAAAAVRFTRVLSLDAQVFAVPLSEDTHLTNFGDWFPSLALGIHASLAERAELIVRLDPIVPFVYGASIEAAYRFTDGLRGGLFVGHYWFGPVLLEAGSCPAIYPSRCGPSAPTTTFPALVGISGLL